MSLVPIYGPMTTIFISQPSASLLCSRPSHPMPAPDTSMCVSHGHLKHNDSNISSCTSIPIPVCAICVNGASTHPLFMPDSNPSLFSPSTSNPSQGPLTFFQKVSGFYQLHFLCATIILVQTTNVFSRVSFNTSIVTFLTSILSSTPSLYPERP